MTEKTPAEVQETEATTDYLTAELDGENLRVLVASKWRPSYLRALRGGDFDTWAEGVIHPDDLETFIVADPTFEEIGEFAGRAMNASGENPGKSGGRSRSSKPTRRR